MKMVMITYNEALEDEVMEVLQGCAMKNYTQMTGVYGKGTSSGTHLGNDIWPGRNNLVFFACEDPDAAQLLNCIGYLRKKLGHEGVKAFVMPLEQMT